MPPTVQVLESVAVFAPVVVGFARMSTVQVPPPDATFAVVQLSVTIEKSVVFEREGAEHPVAFAVPEFVSVNVTLEEFVLMRTFPNAFERGDHASEGAVPVAVMRFAVVVGVPPTVQTRESVAVFAPVVVGFARTSTVQVPPPEATSAVVQLSVTIVKSVVFEIVGAEHPVAFAVPEFVRVKVALEEFVLIKTFPNAFESGDHASDGPVPVTVMRFAVVETVPPVVHVRESVAVFTPVEFGFARTSTAQVAPPRARSVVPQRSVMIVKSVVFEREGAEHPVAAPVPLFVSVKVWFAEFEPVRTFPKSFERGDHDASTVVRAASGSGTVRRFNSKTWQPEVTRQSTTPAVYDEYTGARMRKRVSSLFHIRTTFS